MCASRAPFKFKCSISRLFLQVALAAVTIELIALNEDLFDWRWVRLHDRPRSFLTYLKRGDVLREDHARETFAKMLAGKLYNSSRCASHSHDLLRHLDIV
jgi:hypothetical protein